MQKLAVLVKLLFRLPSLYFFLLLGFGLYIQYELRGKDFESELEELECNFQDVISFLFWLVLIVLLTTERSQFLVF